eukprot:12918324-Prorocentrum_lima.AAC.1
MLIGAAPLAGLPSTGGGGISGTQILVVSDGCPHFHQHLRHLGDCGGDVHQACLHNNELSRMLAAA